MDSEAARQASRNCGDSLKRRRFGRGTNELRNCETDGENNSWFCALGNEEFVGVEGSDGSQEAQAVTSRCAVKSVYDVISSFDSKKRQMVEAIGFGGLLSFPCMKELNRRFTVWLMSKVDELSQTLVIDEGKRLPFSKDDVGFVFGIPHDGKRIKHGRKSRKEVQNKKEAGEKFGQKKEDRSIKRAQEIIEREYGRWPTEEEEDSFKRSFVVFVMSYLLAPGSRHDYACGDYWDALVDTGAIKDFDWASYVIQRLLDGVVKLKTDMMRRIKVSNIIGCSLFLQVLYLDSVDLGVLNMEHSTMPRIKVFCDETLSRMIAADCFSGIDARGEYKFGASNLRPRHEVCYSWARHQTKDTRTVPRSGNGEIWESLAETANRLHVPTEAIGPVYLAIMEIRRKFEAKFDRDGKMLMRSIGGILKCYMEGYMYNHEAESSGSNGGGSRGRVGNCVDESAVEVTCDGGCCTADFIHGKRKLREVKCSANFCSLHSRRNDMEMLRKIVFGETCSSEHCSAVDLVQVEEAVKDMANEELWDEIDASADACDEADSVKMMVSKAMARFYLLSRRYKATKSVDLNRLHVEMDVDGELLPRKVYMCLDEPRCPWELGNGFGTDFGRCNWMLEELAKIDYLSSKTSMFVHYVPKFVEVSCGAARMQFTGRSDLEMDLLDVLLRRFKQKDDVLHAQRCGLRWRHFMESDFMASIIAGWSRRSARSIREQFIGSHLGYDVPNCKMIFFPLLLECRWVCYVWSLEDNEVVIFDPVLTGCARSCSVGCHGQIVAMLQRAMHYVAGKFFVGWHFDWFGASIRVLADNMSNCRRNRSGLLVAYFCLFFDGRQFVRPYEVSKLDEISSFLISEAIQLEDNFGTIPEKLKE